MSRKKPEAQQRYCKLHVVLKRKEVPFIGHLLIDHGIKPDPRKVEAILDMPKPEDVLGV